VDFTAIQETKIEEVTNRLCCLLWGCDECDWVLFPLEGNSGGILSLWKKSYASFNFAFSGEGYVGVCLGWRILHHKFFVINVYNLEAKRRLWEKSVEVKRRFGDGAWCVVGDFNVVRRREERRGVNMDLSYSQVAKMNEFNFFLNGVEWEDVNILGRKYTWYHPNGQSMSRIDRVLISDEWSTIGGDCSLWVLTMDVSDHCLLVLKGGGGDWGPKPFRFNKHWLENRKFKRVVEEAWEANNVTGWMRFVLKEKLKGLKGVIREWNKWEYGELDSKVAALMGDIVELDVRGEGGNLSNTEVETRKT